MTGYGQFCPVSKSMEILDERWTVIVIRELLQGSSRFNEIRKGVPRMSPALLSKRLRSLERHGVVRREGEGSHTSYHLTEAGQQLRPVIMLLTEWGMRWVGELGDEDLDPHLLMWDLQRSVPIDRWPRTRTVVVFQLLDTAPAASKWWLVVAEGGTDLCDYDPGFEVNAVVTGTLRDLTRLWRGDLSWPDALRSERISIAAPTIVQRQVPQWIGQSQVAAFAVG